MKKSILLACSMIFILSMNAQNTVHSLVEPLSTKQSPSDQKGYFQSDSPSEAELVVEEKKETSSNDNLTPMQKLQKEHSLGGLEISCNGWETVGMVDIALTRNWWYIAIAPTWGVTNEYIKENIGFRLGGGFHKRFNLTRWLYLDGRVGLHYGFTKMRSYDGEHSERKGQSVSFDITVKDYSDKKYHNGLLTFRPCIGFNLFQIKGNDFSIFGAYEGSVSFNGGDYGNSWSAGICFGI